MWHHFVGCIDDQIIFRNDICYGSNIGNVIPIERLMTQYGLILPLNNRALLPFQLHGKMFHTKEKNEALIECIDERFNKFSKSLLIDRYGEFYLIVGHTVQPKFTMDMNNILHGDGLRFALSDNEDESVVDTIGFSINQATSVDEFFSIVSKATPICGKHNYRIYSVEELCTWVNNCFEMNTVIPFSGNVIKPSAVLEEEDPKIVYITGDQICRSL